MEANILTSGEMELGLHHLVTQEACGQVDRALDLRSKGLEFDYGHMQECWASFSFLAAYVHPAVMGT